MAHRVCPWWLGYMLISPLRKLRQDPYKILNPFIKPGMTVLDIGSAMGYFTIPMAKMIKENGKVIALDVQEKMLKTLKKRAIKNDVNTIIEPRLCSSGSFGIDDIENKIDFALAFAVVHEIPDVKLLFQTINKVLKPGCNFLIAEPKGHVTEENFETTIALAAETGFSIIERPEIKSSHSVLLKK